MAAGETAMRSVVRELEKVPDEAVTDLLRWMVPRSEQIGGRMVWFGKRVKLTVRPRKRRSGRESSAVTLIGVPVSGWSIKSYGRKGGYEVRPRRREALSLRAFAPGAFFAHVTVRSGTRGDGRWERLVAEADVRFGDIVSDAIDRAVR